MPRRQEKTGYRGARGRYSRRYYTVANDWNTTRPREEGFGGNGGEARRYRRGYRGHPLKMLVAGDLLGCGYPGLRPGTRHAARTSPIQA